MRSKWIIFICVLNLVLSIVLGGLAGYLTATVGFERQQVPYSGDEQVPESSEGILEIPEPTESQTANNSDLTIVEVAQLCTKSVVNITVKEKSKEYTGGSAYTETIVSHGTGVIVREDGYIVTCHHVIKGADSIYVTFDDQTECDATLVGFDDRFDLAVIRVDKEDLPVAQMGDSDDIDSGEGVVIIGNPLGEFGSSVSAGILSAPTRELTIEGVPLRLMQTDAAVNPGNSGGGMFNMRGQLIAMVNAKISSSGIEGIGFAIPLNTISQKVDSIISSGSSGKSAVLGVSTKSAICYIDGESVECLEIASVRKDSAAAAAGLKTGDYLLSVNGKTLKSNDDLTLVIKYLCAGDQAEFEVYRNQKTIKITATLR